MDIPRDNDQFLAWAKSLDREGLYDLEIELHRRILAVELQLTDRDYQPHTPEWRKKALFMLKFDHWRLDTTQKLLKRQDTFSARFVQAAQELLDPDTFGVLAGRATSIVGTATSTGTGATNGTAR